MNGLLSCVPGYYEWQVNSIKQRFSRSVLEYLKILLSGHCSAISLTNGEVISYDTSPGAGKYPYYTRVSISCDSGHYGVSEVRCRYPGYWSLQPRCDQGNHKIHFSKN